MLITGCDAPLAWYLAKKLDDLGFTVYAGFAASIEDSDEAKILKEETSGRMKLLNVDVTSEKSVSPQTNKELLAETQTISCTRVLCSFWKRPVMSRSICHMAPRACGP